jgi:hypothetical protein
MGKRSNEIEDLENGIIPDSMNFSLDYYVEKKSIMDNVTYKTFTPEFVMNYFDEVVVTMFPALIKLAENEYEQNKCRTPLEEIEIRIAEAQHQKILKDLKSKDILYEC